MAPGPERNPTEKPTKLERRLARLLALEIASKHKANREFNLRAEMELLEATLNRQIYGKIIIEPRGEALATAIEASDGMDNHSSRAFFVDGSFQKRNVRGSDCSRGGCGVAFKTPGQDAFWYERWLYLPKVLTSVESELLAIAEGLAIATADTIKSASEREHRLIPASFKTMIFTDCQTALTKIDKFRTSNPTQSQISRDPIMCRLVTRSQYLRSLGIEVELRWVPGHAGVKGNKRAHAMARHAVLRADQFIEADEGLQLMGFNPPNMPGLRNKDESFESRLQRLRRERKRRPIFKFGPRTEAQMAVASTLRDDVGNTTKTLQYLQRYREEVLDNL
ncbi:hypothetical protein K491DRAFT_720395 [Lophiostoma macrostomum CBS 122681]|uniref:RNase H type-1 domain-containing protein n=1 Tax=Lophiostoma macrostomum CBS 122681 TaxID=1314788 RepID=A0A6A6SUY6_9PLEO|nr:hypothetical protein K491DRAFT_720395 [Lophiostoma macrostomum CBS 122681]